MYIHLKVYSFILCREYQLGRTSCYNTSNVEAVFKMNPYHQSERKHNPRQSLTLIIKLESLECLS